MSATRLIDPSTDELRAALAAVSGDAGRSLMTRARAEPQGVEYLDWDSGQATVAAWWPDALGRRHWAIHPEALVEWEDFPNEHPLLWIALPLAAAWRERGGGRELVVICRCGAAGTPESVAWMGRTCGPCHDREMEGLAPLGPEVFRPDLVLADDVWLAADGTLVTRGFERDDATDVIDGTNAVRTYAGVDDGRLLWEHGIGDDDRVKVGPFGVVVAGRQRVTVLDPRPGVRRLRFETGETGLVALAVAGPDLIFTLHPERLRVWRLSPDGPPREEGGARLVSPPYARLLPAPGGRSVLRVLHRDEARLIDPAAGTTRPVWEGMTTAAVWLPDGALALGGVSQEFGAFLGRWDAPEQGGAAPSRLHRFEGAAHACNNLDLGPDGGIVARWWDGGVCVHDPATMAPRSGVLREHAFFRGTIAFTPDGRVLIPASGGLTAWPYRGLFD
jgi:hypothetical protein